MQGLRSLKSVRGMIFITVMVISMLMILIGVSASNMLLQDAHMVKHLKRSMQAQYIAEAGVSDALASLVASGFSEFSSNGNTLGAGEYDIDVTETTVGSESRWLITSTGTVENVSRTTIVEVRDTSSPTLQNALSAGTNIMIRSNQGDVTITGDIHANNDLTLKEIGNPSSLQVTGAATCSSSNYDVTQGNVSVGTGSGGSQPQLAMPVFNFAYFKQIAETGGGKYYDGNQSFSNDLNIDEGNAAGITYVSGEASFTGTCKITGGFVATGRITLNNGDILTQVHDAGNRFPIFMCEEGSRIKLYGQFDTAEGNIIYATNDIQIQTPGGASTVAGTVIAGGSFTITANNDLSLTYGLITAPEVVPDILEVVSWNR